MAKFYDLMEIFCIFIHYFASDLQSTKYNFVVKVFTVSSSYKVEVKINNNIFQPAKDE